MTVNYYLFYVKKSGGSNARMWRVECEKDIKILNNPETYLRSPGEITLQNLMYMWNKSSALL